MAAFSGTVFAARQHVSAIVNPSVRPSVRPSVTRWHCVKTTQLRPCGLHGRI